MVESELRTLAADLRNAGAEATRGARQVVTKTAFDLVAASQPLTRYDTGYLRGSIDADLQGNAHMARAIVGPTAEYGPEQEYGTRYQSGTHYMSRGTDIVEPGFIAAMEQVGIDPIVGR